MRYLLYCLIFLIPLCSYSQHFKISGTLIDAEDKKPLEAATVFMETASDSTLLTYTISDRQGRFILEGNTGAKKVQVNISFVGYQSYYKAIDMNQPVKDLGTILLHASVANLDEIIIKSRAPVTIKKDTLEFNVASFKTKKDATIEDLLKELPGVEVDPDGKISVNGKEVKNVMVNGKPFFGNDPTIATRNLTKEIIEKVQIVDTKSKSEAFTGEEGDKDSKTINLTIKEENNKGVFGRVAAGGGTDDRFEFAGLFNYFRGDRRLSILAGGNNINSPGFSFGEIQKMFGGGRSVTTFSTGAFSIDGRSFGTGNGIINSRVGGAHYADVITKKVDVSADYFYSGSDHYNDSQVLTEYILPDRRFFSESKSHTEGETDNHSVNMAFDVKLDSTLLINIKPKLSYGLSKQSINSQSRSFDEDRALTNSGMSDRSSETQNREFANTLSVTKKFGSRGSFVRLRFSNQWRNREGADFNYNETNIFGDSPSHEIRDYTLDDDQKFTEYDTQLTYRLPLLSKKLFLNFKYGHRYAQTLSSQSAFNFDALSQSYSDFNLLLSTDYDFKDSKQEPGASLSFVTENLSLEVGADYVFQSLRGKDGLRPGARMDNAYESLDIKVFGSYKFNSSTRLYANYGKTLETPDIIRLLPNTDYSNPLNIITGNPDLRPETLHSFYMGLNNFNFQKGGGVYLFVNARLVENAVVSKTIVDENNVRNTTFANVNGNQYLSSSLSYSRKFKLDSLISISPRVGFWGMYGKNVNFNNGLQYESKILSATPNAYLKLSWTGILDLWTRYGLSFRRNSFEENIYDTRTYTNHTVDIGSSLFVPKGFEWRNEITYDYNPDISSGFQKDAWFWNSTLAYSFLKEKATVTLKVYDLLNQNTNARRYASNDFIRDSQSTVLRQYFMLTFGYKFNTLGPKGETGTRRWEMD